MVLTPSKGIVSGCWGRGAYHLARSVKGKSSPDPAMWRRTIPTGKKRSR